MEQATTIAAEFVADLNRVILFPTIALLSAVALLVFIYGCFQYIAQSDNEQSRQQGARHIAWGIIGLVVMMSAYAILNIAVGTFGLGENLRRANEGEVVRPMFDPDPVGPIDPAEDPDATGSIPPDFDPDVTGPI